MDVLDVHLDATEEGGEEGEADGLLELIFLFLVLLSISQALFSLFLLLGSRLPNLFTMRVIFSLFLFFALSIFGSDATMHLCDIGEWILAIIRRIDIPSVVL